MESQQKTFPSVVLFLKVFVAVLPASLVGRLLPHERMAYGLTLIAGVLLAGLIPPRKGLVPLLAITSIIVLIYVRFFA